MCIKFFDVLRKKLYYCCSVSKSCPAFCDPMNCSTPGFPVLNCFLEFIQTPVCWVHDAIQPSHPLSSPFTLALYLSQHQGLFQWVGSLHQVAKVLELQLQHQSFQWIFKVDFPYMYVCVYIYICVCVYIYSHTYVYYIYACMYIWKSLNFFIQNQRFYTYFGSLFWLKLWPYINLIIYKF